MKKYIKYISVILAVASCFCFSFVAYAESLNWYCIRNKEHRQPQCEPNMRFIEQYNAIYVDKKYGDNEEKKVVYLTFDAGYENGNVSKILDILKAEDAQGAFFILENLITKETALVKRMAEEGHTVCNHTCRHRDMTRVNSIDEFSEELKKLEDIYREYTGYEMSKLYRPPEGKFDEKSLKFANELGYKTVFWSLAYADWDNDNQPSPDAALKKLLNNVHNGAVILLHPTSATNVQILSDFIRKLKSQGYSFGSLLDI